MKLSEYIDFDGIGLAELVKKGEVTAEELAELSFTQLKEVDQALNAVTQTRGAQAKQELKQLDPEAPFAGVPFYLKDISQTIAGEVSSGGSKLMAQAKAPHTSKLVKEFQRTELRTRGYTALTDIALTNI